MEGTPRQRGGGGHGVGTAVRDRIECPQALGDGIAARTCEVDELVQLQMEISEVRADDVPVRLLALQMQFDQVDQDLL